MAFTKIIFNPRISLPYSKIQHKQAGLSVTHVLVCNDFFVESRGSPEVFTRFDPAFISPY